MNTPPVFQSLNPPIYFLEVSKNNIVILLMEEIYPTIYEVFVHPRWLFGISSINMFLA